MERYVIREIAAIGPTLDYIFVNLNTAPGRWQRNGVYGCSLSLRLSIADLDLGDGFYQCGAVVC